ncbi:MAG: RNA methyltransferase [Anaerolineae bacterium]|jgi:TrmH family RNA methyltransferase
MIARRAGALALALFLYLPMEITSHRNDKVRLVRTLQARRKVREEERLFVIEGVRLGEEAARAGVVPRFVFYTQSAEVDGRMKSLLSALGGMGAPCYEVSESVMEICSDVETPQGLLAVVPISSLPRSSHPTLTLILDQLRDPGNLGTILRTALAAGVEEVLLAPGTVDATNPKVVRAGAGAHFRLPVAALEWEAIAEAVAGCRVYLAQTEGDRIYTEVDWSESVAVIVGGEAAGAGRRARALALESVFIPMTGEVESLNAAVATAVVLFEVVRQRRGLG